MSGEPLRLGRCNSSVGNDSLATWSYAANCSASLTNTTELCRHVFNSLCPVVEGVVKVEKPSAVEVWGYGVLFVLLVSLSSVVGVVFLPLMKTTSYKKVLMGMVGLAVGCLCGSAILHLIPQAFELEGETPAQLEAYLFKALVVIAAIYAFFLTERLLKLSVDHRKRVKRLREKGKGKQVPLHSHDTLHKGVGNGNGETSHLSDESLEHCSSVHVHIPPAEVKTHHHEHDIDARDAKEHPIKTVAWMVITGDGLVDGLTMGAAFSQSILKGISISIAVLCEELPHELGDLAILLNSGMSLKKALLYNFLSACTCFLGLIVGVLLGDMPSAATWIFAVAGGMFLYISLVDMLPEMTAAAEEASGESFAEGLWMLFIQNVGMVAGFTIMFLLARYNADISLE